MVLLRCYCITGGIVLGDYSPVNVILFVVYRRLCLKVLRLPGPETLVSEEDWLHRHVQVNQGNEGTKIWWGWGVAGLFSH